MKIYGRTTVREFLGDRMVYRNLAPQDATLPSLDDIRPHIGLPAGYIPRKNEESYARVIVYLLQQVQAQRAVGVPIERLVFIGDTRLLDGTAYANICKVTGWPGWCFIGSEDHQPASSKVVRGENGEALYLSNRWSALADFDRFCVQQHFVIDVSTAIVIDMDKTILGARGRNAHVIDRARVQAVHHTVAGLLGEAFDHTAFRDAYDLINRPEFHPFTTDNQDYVAYICLILGTGLYTLDAVVSAVHSGQLKTFEQFIAQVDARRDKLAEELEEIHAEIYANVRAGDPTPFKAFRRNEYCITVGQMGRLDDTATVDALLADEIVLTQEVRALALDWQGRGALLFGLSDKPDEAATPTVELAAQGYQPLHRVETHAVGE